MGSPKVITQAPAPNPTPRRSLGNVANARETREDLSPGTFTRKPREREPKMQKNNSRSKTMVTTRLHAQVCKTGRGLGGCDIAFGYRITVRSVLVIRAHTHACVRLLRINETNNPTEHCQCLHRQISGGSAHSQGAYIKGPTSLLTREMCVTATRCACWGSAHGNV